MANQDQKDNRNQQNDSRSTPQKQDDGKYKPNNPNDPRANETTPGTQQGNQFRTEQPSAQSGNQRQGTSSTQSEEITDVEDNEQEMEDTEIQKKPGESDADFERRKGENKVNQKRNM